MTRRIIYRTALRLLVAGLVNIPLLVSAQTLPTDATVDWRSANDTVGQFRRGHADVLKWEQGNIQIKEDPVTASTDLVLMSADEAVRRAWRIHRSLATPLAVIGPDNVDRIAAGRWTEVDATWLRRVKDSGEVLDVAAAARKVWLKAVAARQVVKYRHEELVAAEAASELGQRMASVGNWSQLQAAQLQITLKTAQMDLRRAQYAAALTQTELIEFLQLSGVHSAVGLPDALPELPSAALTNVDVQLHLTKVIGAFPRADIYRTRASAMQAFEAYQTSHALALGYRDIVKLREFIKDETVLHYNGMLKSVWDLLGEARSRSQAVIEAIDAQRDFWIAETDLQHVLQGGAPASLVSLAGGGSKDSAAAGH